MVESRTQHGHNEALTLVRSTVAGIPEFESYVEKHIHEKGHMFAEHIIRTYPGTLFKKGTQSAEANHSSIFTRLGRQVEAPVKLVESLIRRHVDICSERNHNIIKHHFESTARASLATCKDRDALLGLGS